MFYWFSTICWQIKDYQKKKLAHQEACSNDRRPQDNCWVSVGRALIFSWRLAADRAPSCCCSRLQVSVTGCGASRCCENEHRHSAYVGLQKLKPIKIFFISPVYAKYSGATLCFTNLLFFLLFRTLISETRQRRSGKLEWIHVACLEVISMS